ncbi:MAG: HEAT repeat domain-containing protein [Gemmatimonadota bacterium]
MKRTTLITTIVAIAPMLASVPAFAAQTYFKSSKLGFAASPPMPRQEQDPAVSLYRQARSRLNDGNYKGAAELFRQIVTRYPRSTYTPDSYYWQAFALYRADEFAQAKELLEQQKSRYPRAATAQDAASLLTRVNGELAKRGDADAGASVASTAKASAQGCSADPEMQAEALNAFLHMNSEHAIPLLKQLLARRDACSLELRRKAVFLVSQQRGAEAEDILLSAARQDPDREVRQQAVFWLSQVPSERAAGYLEDILKNSTDTQIRDKAIFALSQHRSERASQIIRDYAENPAAPRELREKAVFWLGQRKGSEAFLKTLYAKEKDAELKDKIIFSLSQQRGNESFLMDVATNANENTEMRKKALFWAGQSKNTSLTELAGLYERMQDREMKEQLIFVYSQRREKEAVDKLMSIARTEPDRELRKKAIFWLSQSKDPRVAEFLMQLINN